MKSIVLRDDFTENEIRPGVEFDKYLDLIKNDSANIFKNNAGEYLNHCPACAHETHRSKFTKLNYTYRECAKCHTLFLSPRPTIEMLKEFYATSKGIKFWNSIILQETKARKKYVFSPRIRWLLSTADINDLKKIKYLDYYSKYIYLFENIIEKSGFSEFYTFKPDHQISDFLNLKGVKTISEMKSSYFSIITAFEIIDRFYNPNKILKALHNALIRNGLLFVTTISASGFDLRILKERSRSIVPPIHLNIFSVEGIITMLENSGFEISELSSPGSLDVDLVSSASEKWSSLQLPPIIDDIINNRDQEIKREFQEFLQRSLLSSHMRIVAKKK
jgi:hypothetical protein